MKWARRYRRRLREAFRGAKRGLQVARNQEEGVLTLTVLWAISVDALRDPDFPAAEFAERDCGERARLEVERKRHELAY